MPAHVLAFPEKLQDMACKTLITGSTSKKPRHSVISIIGLHTAVIKLNKLACACACVERVNNFTIYYYLFIS